MGKDHVAQQICGALPDEFTDYISSTYFCKIEYLYSQRIITNMAIRFV